MAYALGYILMAPTTVLALPVNNSLESRIYLAVGYSPTTSYVTLAVLFAIGAVGNAALITYLRTSDARY